MSTGSPPPQPPHAAEQRSLDDLIEEAQSLERAGRRTEARTRFEAAIRLLPSPDPVRASTLLRWIALSFEKDSQYAAAEDVADAAVAVAECSGDATTIAFALNVKGVVCWRQGALKTAQDYFRSVLQFGARGSDPRVLSHANTNLGTIASVQGDFREAVRYFEEALSIGRQHALPENILPTLINIGVTNMALSRLDAAGDAFVEASSIADALGTVSSRIIIDINRASLDVARGDLHGAKRFIDGAIAMAATTGDRLAQGEAQKVDGIIARERGDFVAAEERLLGASRIATELDNQTLLGESARELAELYSRLGRNREMLQALNRARHAFDQLRNRHELADVARRMLRLEDAFLEVARRWSESIESKDRHTQGHCERVADLSTALAEKAGFDDGTRFWFGIGALLHDVGKLIIPEAVLNKSGPLSEAEWEIVRRHPVAGVEMLADVEFPWDIIPMVRHHHERLDGRGYPDGLSGNDIPVAARILCIADVYDALTVARSYKRPFTHLEAMEIMRRDVGTQFDPALFALFEDLMRARMAKPRTPQQPASVRPAKAPANAEEDDLTGALLRRPFIELATAVLAERRRTNGATSLLVLDIDQFKTINDTYGHLAGDDALREVGDLARRLLKSSHYFGRYAGDEFVVLLSGVSAEGAVSMGELLRAGVSAAAIPQRNGGAPFRISVSIGVATAPTHAQSYEDLFAAADRALFESKRNGRNCVTLADDRERDVPRISFTRFVGRQRELRSLVHALELSVTGTPQLRIVIGEAGVGKTTLLRHLNPELRLRSAVRLEGRIVESLSPLPFACWADIVADAVAQGIMPAGEWPLLSRLVPSVSGSSGAGADFDPIQTHQMLRELVRLLREIAVVRPVVVVIEDAQWADAASWEALDYLTSHLDRDRICVLVTLRREEAASGLLRDRRQRLSRNERCADVRVERLTGTEISEMLQQGLQSAVVDPALYDFVVRRTEGNPFLLTQLLGAMVEEGAFTRGPSGWRCTLPAAMSLPSSMTDLVSRRLNRLSPDTARVLAHAAAIGRSFSLRFVAHAAGLSYEAVLDAVDEALTTSVIEPPAAEDSDTYQFAHALLVDAVLATMNGPRRRAAHERIGDLLAADAASPSSAIANQYARSGNKVKAFAACRRAADDALVRFSLDETRHFLELALAAADADEQQIDVHDKLARVAELSGRWADVELACDHLLTSAAINATPIKSVSARLRRLQARFRLGARDVEVGCHDLIGAADACGSASEIVQTRALLVQLLARKGEIDEALALAEETQRLAEAMGDEASVADAMYRRAITLNGVRPLDAATLLRELIDLVVLRGDRVMEARAYLALGVARSRTDDDQASAEAFRIALDRAREAQALDVAANASMNLGVIELRAGAFERARSALTDALRSYTTLQNNANRLAAIYNLANVERESGATADAARLYEETVQLATALGADDIRIGAHAGSGLSAIRLGDMEQAITCLDAARTCLDSRSDWWFQGRELLESLTVRVLVSRGDLDGACARFESAVLRLEGMEWYASAWLVADCASLLVEHAPAIWDIARRHATNASLRRLLPISARFTALDDMAGREGTRATATA